MWWHALAKHHLEVNLYPDPNPALAQVLTGPGMKAVVVDYTAKVTSVFTSRIAGRARSGNQVSNVSADAHIGGRRGDRWVGEITSGAEYAAADELGRHKYNPYEGSHDLRESLYSVLPSRI